MGNAMMLEGKPVSAAGRIPGVIRMTVAMAKKTFSRLVRAALVVTHLGGPIYL